jgi:hypothetical protein
MERVVACLGLAALLAAPVGAQQAQRVVCDGTVFQYTTTIGGGEDVSPKELEEMAAEQLKKEVLDQCGNVISSVSEVSHSQITLDRMIASFTGIITQYRQIRWQRAEESGETVESTQKYELTVELAVRELPGKPDPDFNVTAKTDQMVYRDGDAAEIEFTLSRPAWVYIFNVSGGIVAQIFPNTYAANNEFAPGSATYPTGRESPPQKIRLVADAGRRELRWKESFVVIATRKPLDLAKLGVKEAVNRPLGQGESADENVFARFLLDSGLRRDEVAQAHVVYEMERRQKAQ